MRVQTQLYEYLIEEAIYFLVKTIPKQKEPRLDEKPGAGGRRCQVSSASAKIF